MQTRKQANAFAKGLNGSHIVKLCTRKLLSIEKGV
jgi:hypothetical protein